ncbi:MAG: hypothetical protein WDO74_33685 [Pseudomonadota bacterium]
MAQRAGLLVRLGGCASQSPTGEKLLFLPASVARWLLPVPRLTKIPWDCAQMALVAGEVVAVIALGEPSGELLLCEFDGQAVALSGLSAVRVGFWPASDSGVSVEGVSVPALDLSAALRQFQSDRPAAQEGAP